MASVKTVVDASTEVNAANFNKFVTGEGTSGTSRAWACWGVHIRYDGAVWAVDSTVGAGITQSANITLTWNAVSTRLEIGLSSITNQFRTSPCAVGSPHASATKFHDVQVGPQNSNTVHVYFFNAAGTLQTTQSTSMDFELILFGEIGP